MFSLISTAFIFLAIIVLSVFVVLISLISRRQAMTQKPPQDPNVIDVKAIDVDQNQTETSSSEDPLLKP